MRKRVLASSPETFDYIIIGAGSAGCVLAHRLSEQTSSTVLVLEAGGADRVLAVRVPAALITLDPKYDWGYKAEPDTSRHNVVERCAAGKVIGGGSSVNAMLWTRGHAGDYDHWAAQGCPGWGFQAVLPYFRRAEHFEGGGNAFRGVGGPQWVSHLRVSHPMTDRFVAAAEEAGYCYNEDYNGTRQQGVAYTQLSQKRGLRHSTACAYLAPARKRRNLTLRTNATVSRILIDGRRAIGVEYRTAHNRLRAHCRREIILAAGALTSPKLLMISGIGPAAHLREHGINVIVDSQGVGQNLQDHPYISMSYMVTVRTLNQDTTPTRALWHGLDFMLRRRGALTSPAAHAIIFSSFDRSSPWSDCEIIFSPLGITANTNDVGVSSSSQSSGDPSGHQSAKRTRALLPSAVVMVHSSICHPKARGTVRLRSPHPEDPPVIRHRLLGEVEDLVGLTTVCRTARAIFRTATMRSYVLSEQLPGNRVDNDDDWFKYLRRYAFRAEHPVGTCRMGYGSHAVVDEQLRVRGIDNLRVIDASIMPTLPSGNTNAPTIMVAEKGSDLIRTAR